MKTQEWLDARQERVEHRLREALHTSELTLGTIVTSFREITHDTVTDSHIRTMARALGLLPVDTLLHLISEAARQMMNLTEDAAVQTTACLRDAVAKAQRGSDSGSVTVASIRAPSRPQPHGLIRVAAALQALVWAVSPPDNNDPLFVA
jgi:hypothetical protein